MLINASISRKHHLRKEDQVKKLFVCGLAVLLVTTAVLSQAGNARRPAIIKGADRVVSLQRTDSGWEGTWYWYVGNTGNATNLTGVTALGLLEAYADTKEARYLTAAEAAADFIQTHLGAGATGAKYHVRTTAPDIVFLYRLGEITGDEDYKTRALLEWNNIKATYATAAALDAYFRTINRPSTWDIAFFLEAAYLSGDTAWANDAAAILANTTDGFYYNTASSWYALNLAGSVRALVGCQYYSAYASSIVSLLGSLIAITDKDNGIDGWVQDTAYAVLAFNAVGGAARAYSNDLGRWLARKLASDACGGWLDGGYEYPECDGEALRALACTIGSNVTLDGFEPGSLKSSSWKKAFDGTKAKPFLEGVEY
jgi:hypothetical protein